MSNQSQRPLERDVLTYLKEHGPKRLDVLYVHFDPQRTASITPALQALGTGGYISVDDDEMTSITQLGLSRLEKGTD